MIIEGINEVVSIIDQLTSTSSTNDKIAILKANKDNEFLKKTIEYTYNPDKKYGVSEKMLNTIIQANRKGICNKNIFELLDTLADNNINDSLRLEISKFASNNKEHWDLYSKMILKDLRCNISEKTISKVWPGLLSKHNVMLASKFEGTLKGKVAATTKMDGIRVSALIENGKVIWKTRQGKIIGGLKELTQQVLNLTQGNLFIDGELLALNPDNLSSDDLFRKTTKIVNSKDKNKKDIEFVTFDICDLEEYKQGSNNTPYIERRLYLENIVCGQKQELISVVKLHKVTDNIDDIYKLLDEVVASGQEGLMLNYIDRPYDFRRSKNILKVKKFHTVDLKVSEIIEGTGKYKGKLGSVIVDYKDYKVNVGSGFGDEDRQYYYNNPNQILNKIIEVSYFEESKNEKGELSLRFPIFKRRRDDKNEVSYN